MSLFPLRHRCTECSGYIGAARPALACTCDKAEPPLPDDPDEHMMLIRGCTLAQYDAARAEFLRRGHVHASNLRWATPTENAADKELHGRVVRGERHQFSKLTEAAVAEIRAARYGEGARLAAKHGIERTHFSRIRNRRRHDWAHVPFPDEIAR